MTLAPGMKLGPYEIAGAISAGGMGEVYRARDTRLERTVAIKILPAHLSSEPVSKQRFEREAKIISNLNHPNICVLYDVGNQDGVSYLVMECVEGETLSKRLEKGPLTVDQTLKFGAQIANALDKAHRGGVVHRDLKPGNIMLTAAGAKLLDFGLAKPSVALATEATLSVITPVTEQGTIVGTFQYMSPEQVEGKELDGRSDIFSLGAVLYEMLTGQKAFPRKSQLSVASAILEHEPSPIGSIKPMTPLALEHAIRRCLAKDPEERWQAARDLELELKWIEEEGLQEAARGSVVRNSKMRERFTWTAIALAMLVGLGLTISFILRSPRSSQPLRLTAETGTDASLFTEFGPSAILTPDGTHLALVARGEDQKPRIYVRALNQLQATVLSGTENARDPFFSPDGQWLGFFADGKLKKISIQGGAPVTICDAPTPRGGSWGEDGSIVFAPLPRLALFKVSSAGGTPQQLTKLDGRAGDLTHRWPQVLPGGKAALFTSNTSTGTFEDAEIMVYSSSSGQQKRLLHGGFYARYLRSGHLVYMHEGNMFAVPFDLTKLEVIGQPVPVLEGIVTNEGNGGAQFSFSDDGNLVYVSGGGATQVSIYWMDRQGKFTPLRATPDGYLNPAFSPDGKRLALEINDGKRSDIWVYEWERDTMTRLTFGALDNIRPVWTPDGTKITYSTLEESGKFDLYWKQANGAGEAMRLTEGKNQMTALSWRPDGKVLAFFQLNATTSLDILTLAVEGNEKSGWRPGELQPFANSPYNELHAVFSPDGRWLAYQSDESGNFEVYVRPFPGPGGKWQISTGGGFSPKWSRNGKELFYVTEDSKIMVANYVATGDSFHADNPRLWSPGQFSAARGYTSNFDLHPDGKRFAVLKASAVSNSAQGKVTLILNFVDELRSKVRLQK